MEPSVVQGRVSKGFEAVQEAFRGILAHRNELGAACCMYYQGEKVVDLWGGILTFLWGIGGLVAFRLAAHLYSPAYPGNPQAYPQLISQKQPLANGLWSLWILGDFMFILPSIAFYLVLRRDHNVLAFTGMLFSLF
ncbi:MAG: hypothetical protein ABSF61_14300 [Anaerolineales bacterium]|jgi:hypothetical protein